MKAKVYTNGDRYDGKWKEDDERLCKEGERVMSYADQWSSL